MFTEADYEALHRLVFRPDYPGYKPTVLEIPNGDGRVDAEKRYAHVAPKYCVTVDQALDLFPYLIRAHAVTVQAARLAGVPAAFLPDARYSALRVLDYPPGSISNKHEDFDLFTLMCYRDQPEYFRSDEADAGPAIERIRTLNPQAHLGQLGEAIGLGRATPARSAPFGDAAAVDRLFRHPRSRRRASGRDHSQGLAQRADGALAHFVQGVRIATATKVLLARAAIRLRWWNVVKTRKRKPSRWSKFCAARMDVVQEFTDDGASVDWIVWALSVEPGQVRLLQQTIAQRRALRKKAT